MNQYECKKVASPGLIMNIHPKITNIHALKHNITGRVINIDANSAPAVQEWKKKNSKMEDNENTIKSFNITTTI
eukprot:1849075-Ditylum_brightwellii.AAC.1